MGSGVYVAPAERRSTGLRNVQKVSPSGSAPSRIFASASSVCAFGAGDSPRTKRSSSSVQPRTPRAPSESARAANSVSDCGQNIDLVEIIGVPRREPQGLGPRVNAASTWCSGAPATTAGAPQRSDHPQNSRLAPECCAAWSPPGWRPTGAVAGTHTVVPVLPSTRRTTGTQPAGQENIAVPERAERRRDRGGVISFPCQRGGVIRGKSRQYPPPRMAARRPRGDSLRR